MLQTSRADGAAQFALATEVPCVADYYLVDACDVVIDAFGEAALPADSSLSYLRAFRDAMHARPGT